MKEFILILAYFGCLLPNSYGRCGNIFLLELQNGVSEQAIRDRFQYITNYTNRISSLSNTDTIRIPVVFNVLYKNTISDSLLFNKSRYYALIDTANKYLNADVYYLYSINHPTFHDIIGVPYIQLIPAKLDPQGQPTDGFRFKQWTTVSGNDICGLLYFSAQQKIKLDQYGGITAWDNRNYLNLWVGDYHTPTQCFSGQSTYPIFPFLTGQPLNFMDGIILQDYLIKSENYWRNYAYSTIMHELGHYLGLLHIWGGLFDDSEKGCTIDDNIRDTPTQYQAIYHCNDSVNSCNDGINDKIDMCSNVMDYADGITFTQQQVNVIRNTLLNTRKLLPIPKLHAQLQQAVFSVCSGDSLLLQWNDLSAVRSDFVIPSWDTSTRVLTKSIIAPSHDTQFVVYLTNGYDTIFEQINIDVKIPNLTFQFPQIINNLDSLSLLLYDVDSISTTIPFSYYNGVFTFQASTATDTFMIYYGNSCSMDSLQISYSLSQVQTALNENRKKNNLHVFPNPATQTLYIQSDDPSYSIRIFSTNGALLFKGENINNIDISRYENGVYILQANTKDAFYTTPFIKSNP